MTNKSLVKNWKNLSLKFKTEGATKPLTDMFMICWGETPVELDGKKMSVVVFDCGGEAGSPALFCYSDADDTCWCVGWDSKNDKMVKANIGTFLKTKKEKK